MNLDNSISSIMTKSVEIVSPEQLIVDIKHLYERPEFHSHIPVVEDGKLVGIVSIVNFMRAVHDASLDDNELVYQTTRVREIMTPNPRSISPDSSIRKAAEILAKGDFHSVVIAEEGQVLGITTTTDILRLILED